jgi:hypothetical protein
MFNSAGVINSYIIGIKKFLSRDADIHMNWVDSVNDSDVRDAIDNLVQRGNDVIMLYTSTDFGIRYAEQIGVKVVAYSRNLPELAPNNYITGFYMDVAPYLTQKVMFIVNNMFVPEQLVGGLSTGHTRFTALNNAVVDAETRSLTNNLYENLKIKDEVFSGRLADNYGNTQVDFGYTLHAQEIFDIRWLEFSVGNNITEFSMPIEYIPITPLIVRGEWHGVRPDHVPEHIPDPLKTEEPPPAETTTTRAILTIPETTEAPNITESAAGDTGELVTPDGGAMITGTHIDITPLPQPGEQTTQTTASDESNENGGN